MGIEFCIANLEIDSKRVKLQFWDTAGEERYRRAISASYFRRMHGSLICFDITNRESFEDIEHWMDMIELHASSDNL